MITPAKWQTAADDQRTASKTIDYKQFRKQLVPHMSKVVFYPDCSDVFNIGQIDGISYYILDKNIHTKCTIENRSRLQPIINSQVERSILNRESLLNIGDEIVRYLGNYSTFKFKTSNKGRYEYWINSLFSLGGGSPWNRVLFTVEGKCKVLGAGYLIDSDAGEKCPAGVSQMIFRTDSLDECKSFISWLNCKFTRFFVLMNISKLTCTYDDDYFRFVPAPPSGKFDHIYTDEELYKAFNLPQKYIDVIEAVIKER